MQTFYKLIILCTHFLVALLSNAQYTRQDTLRGSNGAGRNWWDVMTYKINTTPDFEKKSINGTVEIIFKVIKNRDNNQMQIDLQPPLMIDSVFLDGNHVKKITREGKVYWLDFEKKNFKITGPNGMNQVYHLLIYYRGKPVIAKRPPWDGGWIFARDEKGRPWMSVACQGTGASVWFPCKGYQGDEPDDGALIEMTIPDSLTIVANGKMISDIKEKEIRKTIWAVSNPINNYNIIPYIGKYINWDEEYAGEKARLPDGQGKLNCSYWVLDYNQEKAKVQFKQVPLVLKAFEYWFGPYPFYEDGFKLVEAPHLGMEHQSAVAYGNGFINGYRGRDLSETGWGLKWDFIIVHEVGHEWFGNSITTKDIADMWVHEGFTNYSETLFTEFYFGKEAGSDYCIGTRALIKNDKPIIGPYGVNREGSGDMYYKGGNMLHTIRQVINDDEKFRNILRGLNSNFYHQVVTSAEVEKYMSETSGINLSKIFDQYLRTTMIPVMEYNIRENKLSFRWANCVKGFNMPVKLSDSETRLHPTSAWQTVELNKNTLKDGIKLDRNFYVYLKETE